MPVPPPQCVLSISTQGFWVENRLPLIPSQTCSPTWMTYPPSAFTQAASSLLLQVTQRSL